MKATLAMEICLMLMLVPLVRADGLLPDSCGKLPSIDYKDCEAIIKDTSLTQAEKKEGILGLLSKPTLAENHDFVFEWNRGLQFNTPPAGVSAQSNGIIRDAWVKVVGISPSVFDTNESVWLVDSSGNVINAYNYRIELPTGTASGDCRTVYSYTIGKEDIGVFLNGARIGSGKVATFSSDAKAKQFKANVDLATKLKTDHYREYTSCWIPGLDWTCNTSCVFSHTEYRTDALSVSNLLDAETRQFSYDFRMAYNDGNGLDTVLLEFGATQPFNEFDFTLDDATLSVSEASYKLNYGLEPYDALHVERVQEFSEEKRNVAGTVSKNRGVYLAELMLEKNAGNCSAKISGDFGEFDLGSKCNLSDLPDAVVWLALDKNSYDANETVKAVVHLSDESGAPLANGKVELKYGLNFKELVTDGSGKAEAQVSAAESKGVVSAEFHTDFEHGSASDTKRIGVVYDDTTETAKDIGIFAGVYYIFYFIAKKKLGVLA
ncbi:MAG: hypothetical protein V1676_00140 [Candidatus Diapherotrites archaeon]